MCHLSLIRDIGSSSTVLLKNQNGVLPLKAPKTIGIIGNGAGASSKGPNGYASGLTLTIWVSNFLHLLGSYTDRGGTDGVLAVGWGSGYVAVRSFLTLLNFLMSGSTIQNC